ncbi:MAG: hypothetical protein HY616_04005 [Candidatus Rokubacteria bacterium]|nr:hypothetical protein [Candidatus Rokubacteria bacterium]
MTPERLAWIAALIVVVGGLVSGYAAYWNATEGKERAELTTKNILKSALGGEDSYCELEPVVDVFSGTQYLMTRHRGNDNIYDVEIGVQRIDAAGKLLERPSFVSIGTLTGNSWPRAVLALPTSTPTSPPIRFRAQVTMRRSIFVQEFSLHPIGSGRWRIENTRRELNGESVG